MTIVTIGEVLSLVVAEALVRDVEVSRWGERLLVVESIVHRGELLSIINRDTIGDDRCVSRMETFSVLKQSFLASIEIILSRIVADTLHGTRNLTVFALLTILRPIYNRPTAATIATWLKDLTLPMTSIETFSTLLSNHRNIHDNNSR